MTFAHPWYFILMALIPLFIWLHYKRRKHPATFTLSTLRGFRSYSSSWHVKLRQLPFWLVIGSFALGVVALARPQSTRSGSSRTTEGINIMMVLDLSTSMLAEDLKPNRIEAAKEVASEFISSRPNDLIGLVVFARESFTQCPMTTDKATLLNLLSTVETGVLTDGTAIGNGLATAVSRLKDVEGKSKVVILLTDGSNNAGEIAPVTAAEIAQAFGVRVYTIGVGTHGMAPYPFQTPLGIQYQNIPVDIDEPTLESMAQKTGGQYFRATDNKSLQAIYDQIDKMEKVKVSVENFSQKEDLFGPFLLWSTILLALAFLLRTTLFRTLP